MHVLLNCRVGGAAQLLPAYQAQLMARRLVLAMLQIGQLARANSLMCSVKTRSQRALIFSWLHAISIASQCSRMLTVLSAKGCHLFPPLVPAAARAIYLQCLAVWQMK
jgi:hypothetical protein